MASSGPSNPDLNKALMELGVPPIEGARALLRKLATDPGALALAVRRLAEIAVPKDEDLPDVDGAVERRMKRAYKTCTAPELLRKPKKMGTQNKRLLGLMLTRVGEPLSQHELALANGLRSATSRRIRELETEHGFFEIRTYSEGRVTHYVLERSTPDIPACAAYWLRRNIRESNLGPHARLVALLSAYVGQSVSRRDLGYVLPEAESEGKGRARAPQAALTRRIRDLRDHGYEVTTTDDGYLLKSLDAIPATENIPPKVRTEVLVRDKKTCADCGWTPGMDPGRRPRQLEVHHKNPQRVRPADVHDPDNLITLCSVCHAGREADLKKRVKRK